MLTLLLSNRYSKGSYATGDDIMAGMVLTKGGKLDYPKPPPKSLSVAPKKKGGSTPPEKGTAPASSSLGTQIFLWLLGLFCAVVLAVVIAPDSPLFVGNVMIFVLSSVLG